MTTRSFQAETIKEALQMVQKEMGPDAIVISARDIPMGPAWQVWKKPGVEVISISPDEMKKAQPGDEDKSQSGRIIRQGRNGAGVEFIEESPEIEWDSDMPAAPAGPKRPQQSIESSLRDVKDPWKPKYLKKDDVQELNQKLISQRMAPAEEKEEINSTPQVIDEDSYSNEIIAKEQSPKVLSRLLEKLTLQGVDPAYINQLKNLVLKSCSPGMLENETRLKEFLVKTIAASLSIKKWPNTETPGRILAFVGLSGCGKTDTLAKIAIFYRSLLAKSVVWICADTSRTGGIAEARIYADASGIPLELAYTPTELRTAVEKHADADLILIDTPGFNPSIEAQEVELASYLSEVPDIQTYLVTSATAKESDALYAYASLKYFNLKGNVISKLDETQSYGSVINISRKSGLPLAFFTGSRKATVGLKKADAELLVQALFSGRWK